MTTFSQIHKERVGALESRARSVGSNMTQICKSVGVARATYERWLQRPPQSITKLDELEAELGRLESEAARAPKAG